MVLEDLVSYHNLNMNTETGLKYFPPRLHDTHANQGGCNLLVKNHLAKMQ